MSTKPAVYYWHVVISGFLQREGQPTGMFRLWLDLKDGVGNNGGKTVVELRSWDDNWSDLAEKIWRARPGNVAPKIKIYAYSWGGASAMILARELRERGIGVDWIVLSDPVYRSRWWSGLWRSMVGNPRIRVPSNVQHVGRFYQRQNWPRGHRLLIESPMLTKVGVSGELELNHQYMDDAETFHCECQRVARL